MSGSKQKPNLNNALQILQQLKETFLDELPERYEHMEDLILQLGQNDNPQEIFNSLFRHVHSLKGSAGTYGVHIISKICHHFEDFLNTLDINDTHIQPESTNINLQYLDLIKLAHRSVHETGGNETEIEHTLNQLRSDTLKENLSGLVVLDTNLMTMICQDTLKELPVQLSVVEDGLSALERLLHEKFDFLIVGKEIKMLNGTAVTYALRSSGSINNDIPVIMITTNNKSGFVKKISPDIFIKKDQDLGKNLSAAVKDIIKQHHA